VSEVAGIQIGTPEADLLYKKGPPTYKDGPDYAPEMNYTYVVSNSCRIVYEMIGGKVTEIIIYSLDGSDCSYWGIGKVAGITTGDYVFKLVKELGEPDATDDRFTDSGGVVRAYHYFSLGVVFFLERERVAAISVG
jgi:hypothetical protein